MRIDTYFGFFATAVFTAMAGALTKDSRQGVQLVSVALSATNTLKLRWSDIDTVILPTLTEPLEVPFVVAAAPRDVQGISALGGGRRSLQQLMEGAVSTALEPFNFITRGRCKLGGLTISKNVTGFTAHHLQGEVSYTMAEGHFRAAPATTFCLRLLVTPAGRDLIESRATEKGPQRALFSINEGAYVCSPQWEPPPPPPGMEQGAALDELHLAAWVQSCMALNGGRVPVRLFRQPVALRSTVGTRALLEPHAQGAAPPTVVRMLRNGDKAQEAFVLVSAESAGVIMQLSRSGQERFLGDFFRVLFGEAAQLWERFGQAPMRWSVAAARPIRAAAVAQIGERVGQSGLFARQSLLLEEGELSWVLALGPHAWQGLMRHTAGALGVPVTSTPERRAIFDATGWGAPTLPWRVLLPLTEGRQLELLGRALTQAKLNERHLAAVAAELDGDQRAQWLAALPVSQRERTESYRLADDEAGELRVAVTRALLRLHGEGKVEGGALADWLTLYAEQQWQRRQHLIDELLPLRHLIYGFDRASLSRMLFDMPDRVLVPLACGAEFPVLDQMRRAVSPGFAVRLLKDVQVRRPQTTAMDVQAAQLALYRRCFEGMNQGRYMVRATPAGRLRNLLHWLDHPGNVAR